jgi:trehalose 6-phosphate synthase/phosphatase
MIKMVNEPRTSLLETDTSWKASFLSLLYQYADQMPGSFVEEKHASIAFHYRQCEPDMVAIRLGEIIDALDAIKGKGFLHILLGHKVIEIKDARIDKGQVAQLFAQKINADCIIIAGDDRTDESMFERVIDSYSIHVGSQISAATIHVPNPAALHRLLIDLTT